jgi:peptide/nickel transport system permease protein
VFARHVLPATTGYLLVQATLLLPAFILAEATLSYVGLGFPEELPTWGTMLADAADLNVITRFPWLLTPAVAIFAVVFAANLLLQGSRREYVQ